MESVDSTFLTKSDERDGKSTEYTDIDDDSIFADFKMPDISVCVYVFYIIKISTVINVACA